MTADEWVVWKYPLDQPLQQIAVRQGAIFRHMDVVKGQPVLWIEQPAEAPAGPEEIWTVRVVGTGHTFTKVNLQRYMGSARCVETGLVWHLYRLSTESGAA